ncbi:aminomethyl-transferring glycine dehydrogenase subunit GcvPA [Ectothiorhodospira shaposhnikovii]|uniref:aminomethyl-transferring glycine dehydrogenase subunit GcvPA n=1 Tax=Ectothiorhodospira shaposhnikovii TaxID=1054 RepID=UPI001904C48B|nr:aminomethyl-transferring glycine dehydrogenase subunit GcvPA [Ectothiorhodospira shaposhnikovii]MBK1672602.1 glycine dehydrogenase (aminomethyl-transferring) [Ectothiorhodospira shaposhnikovii]MCG5511606.1 aminomethyl-transferring glycine dehydrogenase subunit GcvPA [Ectothiorhodospira shaposhnikovii]
MPFIPHTDTDVREMLAAIGADSIETLFDEIPAALRVDGLNAIPPAVGEMEITRLMEARAAQDVMGLNFIGAGAYEHHIPAAVWQIVTRGEFYSAYTPYQAEASQGTLQVIYEYQSMMAGLTGLPISNASLYDGASALSEAVLMAVRANRRSKSQRVLMPLTVHPAYRSVTRSIVASQGIEIVDVPFDPATGRVDPAALEAFAGEDITALVIPQPNFFGVLEEVDALTDWAHANGAQAIGVVNPVSLALLTPPGAWGRQGVDMVVGDGQPLGAPLSSGGPYFGFLCCRKEHVRQMPGRIVGRTVDADGRPGFVLTLQAREQHIRRSKATSNICTNQGLVVTAATIHMALLGPEGLERVAGACVEGCGSLVARLRERGFEIPFTDERFHEFVLRVGVDGEALLERMAAAGVLGGHALGRDYPELSDAILVCVTETKTAADLDRYVAVLEQARADLAG